MLSSLVPVPTILLQPQYLPGISGELLTQSLSTCSEGMMTLQNVHRKEYTCVITVTIGTKKKTSKHMSGKIEGGNMKS